MSDLSDTAPAKQVGEQVEIATINSITEITDEDFNNPTRSIILPSLPQRLLNLIGKKLKPVLLKKNVLEKNKNNHPELSAEDNRKILDAALYHAEEIINDKPSAKPNYWVLAKIDGKSSMVTIEISETKDAHEIVGWRFASEKSMNQIRNRAGREGGQVLVTESDAQGSSDLHDLSSDTANTIPQSAEKSSVDSEKIIDKITSAKAGSRERIMAFTDLVSRDVYEAAKDSIQKIIDNGQFPLLAFAYRNPADAWFNGAH